MRAIAEGAEPGTKRVRLEFVLGEIGDGKRSDGYSWTTKNDAAERGAEWISTSSSARDSVNE
jgi:hypothetical protein